MDELKKELEMYQRKFDILEKLTGNSISRDFEGDDYEDMIDDANCIFEDIFYDFLDSIDTLNPEENIIYAKRMQNCFNDLICISNGDDEYTITNKEKFLQEGYVDEESNPFMFVVGFEESGGSEYYSEMEQDRAKELCNILGVEYKSNC